MVPNFIANFLWNFSAWAVLGVFGGIVSGKILDLEYLGLLSSAWTTMSSSPYS